MRGPGRSAVLETVARAVLALPSGGIVRVGIDGVDGAGKTTFGDELASVLDAPGRPALRATVDRFHNPRSVRYRLGKDSPEGFFRESYDYDTLRRTLLDPLSPGGSRRFRREMFDVDADTPISSPEEVALPGSILVFDGMFLHRPELRGYWDYSVFLDVEWVRNHNLASPAEPGDPRNRRYEEGQAIYLRECRPRELAAIVVDNHDFDRPVVRPAATDESRVVAESDL